MHLVRWLMLKSILVIFYILQLQYQVNRCVNTKTKSTKIDSPVTLHCGGGRFFAHDCNTTKILGVSGLYSLYCILRMFVLYCVVYCIVFVLSVCLLLYWFGGSNQVLSYNLNDEQTSRYYLAIFSKFWSNFIFLRPVCAFIRRYKMCQKHQNCAFPVFLDRRFSQVEKCSVLKKNTFSIM